MALPVGGARREKGGGDGWLWNGVGKRVLVGGGWAWLVEGCVAGGESGWSNGLSNGLPLGVISGVGIEDDGMGMLLDNWGGLLRRLLAGVRVLAGVREPLVCVGLVAPEAVPSVLYPAAVTVFL